MMNEPRHATGSIHDSVLVITLPVEVRDAGASYALRDEILFLVDSAKRKHAVLDFRNVTFMGSIALLALLAVRRHLRGGTIVLCNLLDPIRTMFEICRLVPRSPSETAPFQVEDSLETALARFSG